MNTPIDSMISAVKFTPKMLIAVLVLTNGTTLIAQIHEYEQGKTFLSNPRRIELGAKNAQGNHPLVVKQYIHSQIVSSTDFILNNEQIQSSHFPTAFILDMYSKNLSGNKGVANTASVIPEESANNETTVGGNVVFANFAKAKSEQPNNHLVNIVSESYGKQEDDPEPNPAA